MSDIHFRLATHSVKGTPMVEVWRGETFIGALYEHHGNSVRFMSKYLDHAVKLNHGEAPSVVMFLKP